MLRQMTMAPSDDLVIESPSQAEHVAALELVFSRWEPEQRAAQVAAARAGIESGAIPSDGLIVARRGAKMVAAGLFQLQPGRAATVCPARTILDEDPSTAERVLIEVLNGLARHPVRLAYAIVDSVANADGRLFRACGFDHLAALLYLVCPADRFPSSIPHNLLTFDPCGPAQQERLRQVVAATYEDTLDCPALNGIRDIDDVLEGYGASATDPALLLVVRSGPDDVGCLLLADHPDFGNLELAYMGLVKGARGRGWGRLIVAHAKWLAAQLGRERLVVAVDETNGPAMAMYELAGFDAWDRRVCYFKQMARSA